MTPISDTSVDAIDTKNGRVQISAAHGDETLGLLVERADLFAGILLTFSQAEELASVLLKRVRLRQAVDK